MAESFGGLASVGEDKGQGWIQGMLAKTGDRGGHMGRDRGAGMGGDSGGDRDGDRGGECTRGLGRMVCAGRTCCDQAPGEATRNTNKTNTRTHATNLQKHTHTLCQKSVQTTYTQRKEQNIQQQQTNKQQQNKHTNNTNKNNTNVSMWSAGFLG